MVVVSGRMISDILAALIANITQGRCKKMSRKDQYRLTTANIKTRALTNEEYQAARLEIAATELLERGKQPKKHRKVVKKHKKVKDWPGKIPYEDWLHLKSIAQEARV